MRAYGKKRIKCWCGGYERRELCSPNKKDIKIERKRGRKDSKTKAKKELEKWN